MMNDTEHHPHAFDRAAGSDRSPRRGAVSSPPGEDRSRRRALGRTAPAVLGLTPAAGRAGVVTLPGPGDAAAAAPPRAGGAAVSRPPAEPDQRVSVSGWSVTMPNAWRGFPLEAPRGQE